MGGNISMMDTDNSRMSEDDSDQEIQLATILQYLIRSGHVQIATSDYDDDEDISPPLSPIATVPNTSVLEKSEISLLTRQACGQNAKKSAKSIASMIRKREVGSNCRHNFSAGEKCKISNNFLPNHMKMLERYDGKVFCSTYSKDGQYIVTACQDHNIRVYESKNGNFKLRHTIQARDVGWSIVDMAFSPDGQHVVYSSWSESLHTFALNSHNEQHVALPLNPDKRRFCVFSVVFSSDGREILGGANDGHLYVYDREYGRRTLRIGAHHDDTNSVAFADDTSQILYSGGDDRLAKVWDRRTLSEENPTPVAVLAGHLDGITYVEPRGDGRYLATNSKDQSIKLWDVRAVLSASAAEQRPYYGQAWDYRWEQAPSAYLNPKKLDNDTSVMTYRGHSVLKTLIRCRFSPMETTGQKYIYTGCATGRIGIYDVLTGRPHFLMGHRNCVRDVSWHPYRQEMVSAGWDGIVGLWTYNSTKGTSEFVKPENKKPAVRRSPRIASRRERLTQIC